MEEQLKVTCLHDSHVALGAKMSPFAGFDMPIQYSSITEEHLAVRGNVGMFDVSHMGEIFVSGPDAEKFVNHIFTNDIRPMVSGQVLYGMMLYPDGGTVDDLLVYKEFTADHYLLVVNAANIEKDFLWIKDHAEGYDVKLVNDSDNWGQIALQGPKAEETLVKVLGYAADAANLTFYTFKDFEDAGTRVIISRTGYTGEDGFEIYAAPGLIVKYWDAFLKAGVVPCGLGCRDTLRFEVGLPLYGDELSSEISPVMAGLSMFCKLDKPEFIGKEALAAQKAEGVKQKVVGIELSDRAIPRHGYKVLHEGEEIGEVTTGYHTISSDKSVCMALIDARFAKLGTELEIQIRKKTFPGVVVKKKFYDKHYKK